MAATLRRSPAWTIWHVGHLAFCAVLSGCAGRVVFCLGRHLLNGKAQLHIANDHGRSGRTDTEVLRDLGPQLGRQFAHNEPYLTVE